MLPRTTSPLRVGTDSAEPPSSDHIGKGSRFGRYVVLERLGEGAAGRVYSAYDTDLERKVALKLLHDWVADVEHIGSAGFRRLVHEARAIARLNHPNVLVVYEVGTWEGRAYLATELVDGQNLAMWLEGEPRSRDAIVAMFRAAGAGLEAAHRAAVVHGDFKPANVLVGRDDRPRVADFGLARLRDPEAMTSLPVSDPGIDAERAHTLTHRSGLVGTPYYMAPEQFEGAPASDRTDQYAFCVALFEALSGRRLFADGSLRALVRDKQAPRLDALARIPRPLLLAIRRGLSTDPSKRWPTMGELVEALGRTRRRNRRAIALGMGAFGGTFGGYALLGAGDPSACQSAPLHLQGVWDDAARHALATAFADAHPRLGPEVAPRVTRILDVYAERWVVEHQSSCLASESRQQSEQVGEARLRCLDDRRSHLHALVRELTQADADVVPRAIDAARALPDLDECGVGSRSLEAFEPPSHDRAAVEAIDAELREVGAMQRIARFDRAEQRLLSLLPRAIELGEARRLAQVRLRLGQVWLVQGKLEDAERELEFAAMTSLRSADDDVGAEASVMLVRALGEFQPRTTEALAWAKWAESWLARTAIDGSPSPFRLQSTLLAAKASTLAQAGRLEEAVSVSQAAVDQLSEVHGPDDPDVGRLEITLGEQLRDLGEMEKAKRVLEHALQVLEQVLGERHPDVGGVLNLLATVHFSLGELHEGQAMCERALAIVRAAFGDAHPGVAMVANNLATMHGESGRPREARALWIEALGHQRVALGPDHPLVGDLEHNLAAVEISLGRPAEALLHFAEAERITITHHGEEHPALVALHANRALALGNLRRFPEALAAARRAVALADARLPAAHPEAVLAYERVGWVLNETGRFDAAHDVYDDALNRLADAPDPTGERWILFAGRGRARLGLGQFAPALADLEHAAASVHPDLLREHHGALWFDLARARRATGDHQGARQAAMTSIRLYRASGAEASAELARIETWLAELPS